MRSTSRSDTEPSIDSMSWRICCLVRGPIATFVTCAWPPAQSADQSGRTLETSVWRRPKNGSRMRREPHVRFCAVRHHDVNRHRMNAGNDLAQKFVGGGIDPVCVLDHQ